MNWNCMWFLPWGFDLEWRTKRWARSFRVDIKDWRLRWTREDWEFECWLGPFAYYRYDIKL